MRENPRAPHPSGEHIELIRPDGLFADAPYAYGTVAPPGRLVFSAGACPLDRSGVVVGPGDLEVQAHQAVGNLFDTLSAAGASAADVLKTTVYVVTSDHEELVRVWRVVEASFEPHDPPSTLLGVAVLGYRDQLVEIEAVALLPPEGRTAPTS